MWKQIKFKWGIDELGNYGFGKFDENGNLEEVICGCCGSTFELDEIQVIKVYDWWVPLEEFIKGDDDE